VNSDGVLRALTDRGLIEEAGREETPGRPVLYGTTPGFLERLGLPSLASLPSLAPLLGLDAEEAIADEPAPNHDAAETVDLTSTVSDDVDTVEIESGSSDDAPV
jgi:segregation and condensation protein B